MLSWSSTCIYYLCNNINLLSGGKLIYGPVFVQVKECHHQKVQRPASTCFSEMTDKDYQKHLGKINRKLPISRTDLSVPLPKVVDKRYFQCFVMIISYINITPTFTQVTSHFIVIIVYLEMVCFFE